MTVGIKAQDPRVLQVNPAEGKSSPLVREKFIGKSSGTAGRDRKPRVPRTFASARACDSPGASTGNARAGAFILPPSRREIMGRLVLYPYPEHPGKRVFYPHLHPANLPQINGVFEGTLRCRDLFLPGSTPPCQQQIKTVQAKEDQERKEQDAAEREKEKERSVKE